MQARCRETGADLDASEIVGLATTPFERFCGRLRAMISGRLSGKLVGRFCESVIRAWSKQKHDPSPYMYIYLLVVIYIYIYIQAFFKVWVIFNLAAALSGNGQPAKSKFLRPVLL